MAKSATAEPETSAKPLTQNQALALREKPPKDAKFGDVFNALTQANDLADGSEFGTGFAVLDTKEKGRLVGVPMIIMDWAFNEGDNGEFVSLRVITQTDEKLVINDGSSGICRQIREIADTGEARAIYIKKGLRVSNYDYTAPDGSKKPASTFYLDFSG